MKRLFGVELWLICAVFCLAVHSFSQITNVIYSFPMDSDPGWQTEGQWGFGQPQGLNGDPSSGYTDTNVYGYNLSGAYANNIPQYWLTTTTLDCSGYTNVVLSFQRWLSVESSSWDHADIQVSSNGTSWVSVWSHSGSTIQQTSWQKFTYDISSVADDQETVYVRWGMGTTDGSVTYGGWNIDDVEICGVSAYEYELTLLLPDNVDEGAGILASAGQLMVSATQSVDLVVSLQVEAGVLSVPEELIIPAGQTNVYFDLTVQDDALLNGSRDVWVEASAEDCESGGTSVSILDNETATLTLQLPDTTYEGIGLLQGILQVDTPPDSDILVELRSSDTNQISFGTVIIPTGQTLVPVELSVVDDNVLDGVKTVVVEAYVHNWTGNSCHVFVFDNEQIAVAPPIPKELEEGSMPWPMYQGNKEHTGYVPVSLVPSKSKKLWSKIVGSGRLLNPATVAEGKVYVSSQVYFNAEEQFFVLDALTGEMKWTKNFGNVYSVNPPSYAYGNIYIQTGNHGSDTYLHAYKAENGEMVFKTPHSAQWERYYAPTIDDGVVYINGGRYGGMYAFDAYSGTQLWFNNSLAQVDQWTPTIGPSNVYSYVGGELNAHDKKTGSIEYSINGGSGKTVAVYGDNGLIYAIDNGKLTCLDTIDKDMRWQNAATFKGQPSYHNGMVYALSGNGVSAVSATSNQVVWSWVPAGDSLSQNIIVTDSHLIVGSASKTCLVDLQTHAQVWSYPKGGHLSLAEGVLYIASSNGELTAVSLLPRLMINVTEEATEGDGIVGMAGSVTIEDILPHDLVVTLFSSDLVQVVPAGSVIIPAGQTNAVFNLEIMDDDLLDGSQLVTIGARSGGYANATATLWVHDNETATLSLELPNSTVEGASGISGMVKVTPIADRDVVVDLVSNNPEKISGGHAVIKAGDEGAAFTLSVHDNDSMDGLQAATIEARVKNWESGRASIFIADNETTDIRLVLPSLLMEGDGVVTNAGEVVLSGTVLLDVQIMLRSSDVSEVTVPFYVTIPAGQSNAFFNVTAVDDDVLDGKQYPNITASAPGFITTSHPIRISDNEFHHFTLVGFDGEDPGYVPVSCSVRAVNMDNEFVDTYNGPVWLSAEQDSGPVQVDPSESIMLTSGFWQGLVTLHAVGDNVQIFIDDRNGHVGTNEVSLAGLNIVKMATDWELPYIYMVHRYTSAPNKSILIWYNTDTESIEYAASAGENVTDLTVHYGDNRIYVSNWKRVETRVFDRSSKQELDPLLLGTDVYHINAAGADRVITEGEDQWITVTMRNTQTGSSIASRSEREGDGDCTLDGRYYYHTDNNSSGAMLSRFTLTNDTFASEISIKTKSYYGSRNVFISMDGCRVYNCGSIYDADLQELVTIGSEIYAASSYGDLVVTATKAFNGKTGAELYTLPFSSTVMTFSGDQSKVLLFNATTKQIVSINTDEIMPIPSPAMIPKPADGSVQGANLEEFSWSGAPAALAYDIYLGTDSNLVASVGTHSVEYLGRRSTTDIPLTDGTLVGNEDYYWRVDVIGFGNTVVTGSVWQFETASFSIHPRAVELSGMVADYTQTASIEVRSASGGSVPWSAACSEDWISLSKTNGMASEFVDLAMDMNGLSVGSHTATITFYDGSRSIPLSITVNQSELNITKMEADQSQSRIYALNVSPTGARSAHLVVINGTTEMIEKVIPVVDNATDFAVHYGDDRIYVSAYGNASVSVIDRSSLERLNDLSLHTHVYRISSGIAGRLVTEDDGMGNGYYGRMHVWDSTTGTELQTTSTYSTGRGTGESDASGTTYFRGDSTRYPYAGYLRKYDLSGGTLVQTKTVAESKSARRELVLSGDGSRLFWIGKAYDAELMLITNLNSEVYAANYDGSLAATTDKVFNVDTLAEVASLPAASTAIAFARNGDKLAFFNAASKTIEWLSLVSTLSEMQTASAEWMRSKEYIDWAHLNFGVESSDAMADHDGDGHLNIEEFIAGTDPLDARSQFVIHDLETIENGDVVLHWHAVTNRVYSVYGTYSLGQPLQLLEDGIRYPHTSYTDRVERVEGGRFYQIKVSKEN